MNLNDRFIKDLIKGDKKAQYQLYKLCFPMLMSVCLRYKKNDDEALAVLNEGFLKILLNIKSYKPDVPFEAWSKRIMINTIIDEFRKYRKVKEIVEYTDFSGPTEHINEAIDYNKADQYFDAEHIQNFIRELPPVSQKVFNLYTVDGYTHKEIGVKLGISEGTSKWHLSFSRKKLQEKIVEMTNNPSKVL